AGCGLREPRAGAVDRSPVSLPRDARRRATQLPLAEAPGEDRSSELAELPAARRAGAAGADAEQQHHAHEGRARGPAAVDLRDGAAEPYPAGTADRREPLLAPSGPDHGHS